MLCRWSDFIHSQEYLYPMRFVFVQSIKKSFIDAQLIRVVATVLGLTLLGTSISEASNSPVNFNKGKGPLSISIVVENADGSSKPIIDGSRIKVRGTCKVDTSLLPKSKNFFNGSWGGTINWKPEWYIDCNAQLKQVDKFGRTFDWDKIEGEFRANSNSGRIESLAFFEKIYTLVSEEPLRISWTLQAESQSADERYFDSSESFIAENENQDEVILIPSAKSASIPSKKSPTTQDNSIPSLDGEEGFEEENPTMKITREKNGSFLIMLDGFAPDQNLSILAKKSGSKSIKFNVITSPSGDLKFRTARNLKGFKVAAIFEGDTLLLTSIK